MAPRRPCPSLIVGIGTPVFAIGAPVTIESLLGAPLLEIGSPFPNWNAYCAHDEKLQPTHPDFPCGSLPGIQHPLFLKHVSR